MLVAVDRAPLKLTTKRIIIRRNGSGSFLGSKAVSRPASLWAPLPVCGSFFCKLVLSLPLGVLTWDKTQPDLRAVSRVVPLWKGLRTGGFHGTFCVTHYNAHFTDDQTDYRKAQELTQSRSEGQNISEVKLRLCSVRKLYLG